MCERVSRTEFDRAAVFLLRAGPIPIVMMHKVSKSDVRLRRLRIKRQRLLHSGASLGHRFIGFDETEIPQKVVTIDDASIRRSEPGIARNSEIEILDGAAEVRFRTLVQKKVRASKPR